MNAMAPMPSSTSSTPSPMRIIEKLPPPPFFAEVVGLLAVVVPGPVLYLDARAGDRLVGAGLLDRAADLRDRVLLLGRALEGDPLVLGDCGPAAVGIRADGDVP